MADNLLDRFLTPEAMMTPGAAGGIVMVISTALGNNFNLPRAHLGIVLSFACGLLVLATTKIWWQKLIYYVLNSLIIFCVAFGSGNIAAGSGGTGGASRTAYTIISSAHADEAKQPQDPKIQLTQSLLNAQKELDRLNAEYKNISERVNATQDQAEVQSLKQQMAALQKQINSNQELQAQLVYQLAGATGVPVEPKEPGQLRNAVFKPWVAPVGSCSIFRNFFGSAC